MKNKRVDRVGSLLLLLPGSRYRGSGGIYKILSLLFYLSAIILFSRKEVISELMRNKSGFGWEDLAGIMAVPVLLYASCIVLPLLESRYERRGSRLVRRLGSERMASCALALVLGLSVMAAFAPILVPSGGSMEGGGYAFSAPSWRHPLGTDRFGRDVLSRVVLGARVTLAIAASAVLLATVLGSILGVVAGYRGGIFDDVAMRITDGLIAVPRLLLVLLLVAFLSNSIGLLILLIACTSWMGVARLVRAEVLSLKEKEFIQAAVATGAGAIRIVTNHLLPNTIGVMVVAATLQVGAVILLESTLSFLGLGVQPPLPSLGVMVAEGREVLASAWWVSGSPGLAIVIAVVAFNVLGDGLRDALQQKGMTP